MDLHSPYIILGFTLAREPKKKFITYLKKENWIITLVTVLFNKMQIHEIKIPNNIRHISFICYKIIFICIIHTICFPLNSSYGIYKIIRIYLYIAIHVFNIVMIIFTIYPTPYKISYTIMRSRRNNFNLSRYYKLKHTTCLYHD